MNTEENKVIASVVSNETGEVLDEIRAGDSYTKRTATQKDYYNTHDINFNKEAYFVKLYNEIVPMLRERLTPTEFIFTISLSEFVCYEDCILRSNGKQNGKILTAKDLSEYFNMNDSNTRKVISSLKKKGVIGQHETGTILKEHNYNIKKVYTVNPYIFCRGTDISTTVKTFYEDSGWNVYEKKQRK